MCLKGVQLKQNVPRAEAQRSNSGKQEFKTSASGGNCFNCKWGLESIKVIYIESLWLSSKYSYAAILHKLFSLF